jgi:ribosome-binding factor A
MSKLKHQREEFMLKDLAADFLARASNRTSLITVTRVILSPDQKRVDIMLSVLPKSAEKAALIFANRMTTEFKEYLKAKSRIRILPRMQFFPDLGEQNRQRIEELLEEVDNEDAAGK